MSHPYDLVLRNARVADPVNGLDAVRDIAVSGGYIADIAQGGLDGKAGRVMDLDGYTIIPGIIDCHAHLTRLFGGGLGGFHMLAQAGVCTALDLAGPTADVFSTIKKYGSGINVATLEALRPGENLRNNDPDAAELRQCVDEAMKNGAFGVKLLGGHFPLTPEASRRAVAAADELGAYMAWHAGSTATGNGLDALEELLELSEGKFVHVAHVNSFCRGIGGSPFDEVRRAFELLGSHQNVYSESYLSESNGTTFDLDDQDGLKSKVTSRILERFGFSNSADGVEHALRSGFARLFASRGLETVPVSGEEAVALWRAQEKSGVGGFMINPVMSRIPLCIGKHGNGDFRVDALASDGGAIPRNVIVSHGLALVELGAFTLTDFIMKTSYNPSRMLGMAEKGHLSPGADADLTVLDMKAKQPIMTVVSGKICMHKGLVVGNGGTIYTTPEGKAAVRQYGVSIRTQNSVNKPLRFRRKN